MKDLTDVNRDWQTFKIYFSNLSITKKIVFSTVTLICFPITLCLSPFFLVWSLIKRTYKMCFK